MYLNLLYILLIAPSLYADDAHTTNGILPYQKSFVPNKKDCSDEFIKMVTFFGSLKALLELKAYLQYELQRASKEKSTNPLEVEENILHSKDLTDAQEYINTIDNDKNYHTIKNAYELAAHNIAMCITQNYLSPVLTTIAQNTYQEIDITMLP